MILPLKTTCPLTRTPYVNIGLIGANVLAFLLQQMLPGVMGQLILSRDELQWYQLIGYQFLHGGLMHLLGNMVFLYVFGNNVNDKLGGVLYLAFYLCGGIVAGLAHIMTDGAPVVGASGSVAAVTGAFIVLFPQVRIIAFMIFLIIGMVEIPAVLLIASYFVMDVLMKASGMSSGVAHMAHIGGTVFGVAVSFFLLWMKWISRSQFDLYAMVRRWNQRRQYRDMVSSGFDPYNPIGQRVRNTKTTPQENAQQQEIFKLRERISLLISEGKVSDAAKEFIRLQTIKSGEGLPNASMEMVANQLFAEGNYFEAANAYEILIKQLSAQSSSADKLISLELLLGVIYGRYTSNAGRAMVLLSRVRPKLTRQSELELADMVLAELKPNAVQR